MPAAASSRSVDPASAPAGDVAPRSWRRLIAPYARPDRRAAIIQLLNTALPFLALMAAIYWGVAQGLWPILVLAVPAAAFLVRLFAIQHDCGHGSFFGSRRANDLLGRVIGVATLTPYAFWRHRHAIHHATSGNLDQRGVGDIGTLTVREYEALSAWRRMLYRLYRHPVVIFGVGPAYQFFIRHRIPTGHPLRRAHEWLSILGTNAVIGGGIALAAATTGLQPLLIGYAPVMLIAATIGVWLFYVQHQFEETYWAPGAEWDYGEAALAGCSYYDLPRVLHWVTAHLGLHHVHHLSSKVPNYRLRACFEANPEFWRARRLSLVGSLKCARLALWDEATRRLVPFRSRAVSCA